MKIIIAAGIVALLAGTYLYSTRNATPVAPVAGVTKNANIVVTDTKTIVQSGTYAVVTDKSIVNWAGKKPLLSGYINQGSIALSGGDIIVTDTTATGSFTIDMKTLSVTSTPTKPGKESLLVTHLKSNVWFDIETYPTAEFTIDSVTPASSSTNSFNYTINGSLTMKGKTQPLSFPATIYSDEAGVLYANAALEFDRTVWGVTAGSASFFDNLADNAVDNMVALSFTLVAEAK